jgi:serine protease AprX
MLAWTDAKGHGLGGSTPAWVNDLDLRVSADGEDYLGNVVGADGWSATGGAADERNNLEGVFLRADQHGGTVTITVDASNIAADALDPFEPGDPAQDFALVCYNCLGEAVVGAADLGLQLSAAPDPVTPGSELVFSAQIANQGPDVASGVRLQLELPAVLSFVSAQTLDGGTSWTCSAQRLLVECLSGGGLPVDANASTLEILTQLSPQAGAGTISTRGEVVAAQFTDIDPADNVQTVLVDVLGDDVFMDGFE